MTDNPVNINTNLRLGIQAARAGQKEEAKRYLSRVLQHDAQNIPAMLWLAFVAASPGESVALLERVLALDPHNERAKAGLQWVKSQTTPEPTAGQPAAAASESTEMPDEFIRRELLVKKEMGQRAKKGALAHRARRTIDPLLTALIVLGAAAILTLGIWALALMPADTLAAWLPPPVEKALMTAEPVAFVPQKESAPLKPVESGQILPEYFTSRGDTITLEAPTPVETQTTRVDMPTAPAANLAEESAELAPARPGEETLPSLAPQLFIAPAAEALNGPRLFEPVDEALLAHQPAHPNEKWIEVNVTEQRVTAWEGNVPVMSFLSSTGLPNTPTVLGKYNIYWKLESTLMAGPGYYLPEVPYTMYFYAGYALHGAYWHDNFGNPMSHGCVNLSIDNSKELFLWADPVIPTGQTQVVATADNPGTLVVVHQ